MLGERHPGGVREPEGKLYMFVNQYYSFAPASVFFIPSKLGMGCQKELGSVYSAHYGNHVPNETNSGQCWLEKGQNQVDTMMLTK